LIRARPVSFPQPAWNFVFPGKLPGFGPPSEFLNRLVGVINAPRNVDGFEPAPFAKAPSGDGGHPGGATPMAQRDDSTRNVMGRHWISPGGWIRFILSHFTVTQVEGSVGGTQSVSCPRMDPFMVETEIFGAFDTLVDSAITFIRGWRRDV
jgi:hypothetical protein